MEDLNALIEAARKYEMSDYEKWAQSLSFAYGNLKLDRPWITREAFEKVVRDAK